MDVDIDFQTNFDPLNLFKDGIRASKVNENKELTKHPAGVYFQTIPIDPITNLAAIPFEKAEELGYFKVDFLHLSLLDQVESKEQLRKLMKKEPNWSLLESRIIVEQLFQLHKHYDIVFQIKPKSVQELADAIALIRPGKRNLLKSYLKNKQEIRKILYKREKDTYSFKKSHAIAYALTIVVQLHLIEQKLV